MGGAYSMHVNDKLKIIFVGKRESKRPLGKTSRRLQDISKWILKKYNVKLWPGLIWLRMQSSGGGFESVMKLWVTCKAGNFLTR
jgi:hypothetical protein